jgi:hypothetical protein
MYHPKKIIKGLSMDYEKIDVCKNNCMIFMKEHVDNLDLWKLLMMRVTM